MYEQLFYDFVKALGMVAIFLLFMLGVARILKYKASIIGELLKIGTKKETTTHYGGISLVTIAIVGVVAITLIFVNEVTLIFAAIFGFKLHDMGSPILLSMFSIIAIALCNFILLGFLFWTDKNR